MPAVSQSLHRSMGLTDSEYQLILNLLGRTPSLVELGMFAVMWSEHCGYKHARPVLAYFKQYREALEGEGFENAGVVDLGDGLVAVMKIESHNHPSAVEPYQGAATGVGGILRDIFAMGARPVALLDSLCFGPLSGDPSAERNRYLFEHVVAGIGGYGNCVGVPTVAGEVAFDRRYNDNPLVNAMCVGIARREDLTTAAAAGPGNSVMYLGSATGRDGIHGATFASDALDEESESRRPNVQIGDPFAGKILIEATLEALRTGAIVAIQDMGAAGLTCGSVEMSSKGGIGMDLDLELVPVREADMSAYEIMLSESQERMLAVVQLGREAEVEEIFRRWGLHACVIGSVTAERRLRVQVGNSIEAELDPLLISDHCPTYTPSKHPSERHLAAARFDPAALPSIDLRAALPTLLASPNIAYKGWVTEQYDHEVGTRTIVPPGSGDAAVLEIPGSRRALAVKVDSNPRQTAQHPYRGAQLAVAEAARNVACVGALPAAITDGLNFGSPEDPAVYWEFDEAVRGIADAAEAMRTPVISGNVSFYNQGESESIPPTPMIGMVGILDDAASRLQMGLEGKGTLCLVGYRSNDPHLALGASAFLETLAGRIDGWPAAPDLRLERSLCEQLGEWAAQGAIHAAHDVSQGGIAVALAEMCMLGNAGASVDLSAMNSPVGTAGPASALYGEWPGLALIAATEGAPIPRTGVDGLAVVPIGDYSQAEDMEIRIDGAALSWNVRELKQIYESAIMNMMETPSTASR